jgi:hypothetical protein
MRISAGTRPVSTHFSLEATASLLNSWALKSSIRFLGLGGVFGPKGSQQCCSLFRYSICRFLGISNLFSVLQCDFYEDASLMSLL